MVKKISTNTLVVGITQDLKKIKKKSEHSYVDIVK